MSYVLQEGYTLGLCAVETPLTPGELIHHVQVWEWALGLLKKRDSSYWIAVEYREGDADDRGMVKEATVVSVSRSPREVADFIRQHHPSPLGVCVPGLCILPGLFQEQTVGDMERVVVGDGGYARAGDRGSAVAGAFGFAKAGDGSCVVVGDGGMAVVGRGGCAAAGAYGYAAALSGSAIAGEGGCAMVGDDSMAIAGDGGYAITGRKGSALAGIGGAVAGEDGSRLSLTYLNPEGDKMTLALRVGESGIQPNTFYVINTNGLPTILNHSEWI